MSRRISSSGAGSAQLELFVRDRNEHLFPYWREPFREWVRDAFHYRHHRDSTGWSEATQGYMFAQLLYRAGQMTKAELRRWWRFDRRLWRMELANRATYQRPLDRMGTPC